MEEDGPAEEARRANPNPGLAIPRTFLTSPAATSGDDIDRL